MATRAMWSGSLSFGLVNIPVKLLPAVKDQTIHFHMLHDQDNVRLQRKMVCPADNQEVHPEHTVQGYQVGPEQYVRVTESELEAVAPEGGRTIEILDFVGLDQIDPMYFDRSYYLEPAEKVAGGAARAYKLIVDAMTQKHKVGVARFVMRGKEYLAAVRPVEGVLCLETMHFGDDVTPPEKLEGMPIKVQLAEREVKAAEQLIENLTVDFDPTRYRNEHRGRVLALLEKKAQGQTVVVPNPERPRTSRASDLTAALEASLAQSRRRGKGPSEKQEEEASTGEQSSRKRHPTRGESSPPRARRRKGA